MDKIHSPDNSIVGRQNGEAAADKVEYVDRVPRPYQQGGRHPVFTGTIPNPAERGEEFTIGLVNHWQLDPPKRAEEVESPSAILVNLMSGIRQRARLIPTQRYQVLELKNLGGTQWRVSNQPFARLG